MMLNFPQIFIYKLYLIVFNWLIHFDIINLQWDLYVYKKKKQRKSYFGIKLYHKYESAQTSNKRLEHVEQYKGSKQKLLVHELF